MKSIYYVRLSVLTACVFTLSSLTALDCFAQSAEQLTKDSLRTGFQDSHKRIKDEFVTCLSDLGLTPEDLEALEESSEDGEIVDPEVLACLEERKASKTALIEEYIALRKQFREQEKMNRETAVEEAKSKSSTVRKDEGKANRRAAQGKKNKETEDDAASEAQE